MKKDAAGAETKMVNQPVGQHSANSKQVANVNTNYQLSPLEYQVKTGVTIPHNNMPPYKEVYIWECVESTDEEKLINGEPDIEHCKIVWDPNGGKAISSNGNERDYIITYVLRGRTLQSVYAATKNGCNHIGWFNENGEQINVGDTINSSMTLTAQWTSITIEITFDANGGSFEGGKTSISKTYSCGSRIGSIPTVKTLPSGWQDETTFDGWYTDPLVGDLVDENTIASSTATYYAHYDRFVHYNKVGQVTLNEETQIASGFDYDRYLLSAKNLDFSKDFEVVVCAKTGSDLTYYQKVMGVEGNIIEFGVSDGKFSWEVDPHNAITTQMCEPNTTYFFRVVAQGTTYKCYRKKNGDSNWTCDVESGTKPASGIK